VFNYVVGQTTFGGALDFNAIKFVIKLFEVSNPRDIFEKVLFCFGIYVKLKADKDKI